jgi:acyl dehydratase
VTTPEPEDVPTSGVTWRLGSDLGRRYAAVSGDRNPIHLYALPAKALGFKRQIAHGMWSKGRCVAALENRLPDAVTVEVVFRKPIFLPGKVSFGSMPTDDGFAFVLRDPRSGAPHLQGRTIRG